MKKPYDIIVDVMRSTGVAETEKHMCQLAEMIVEELRQQGGYVLHRWHEWETQAPYQGFPLPDRCKLCHWARNGFADNTSCRGLPDQPSQLKAMPEAKP